MNPYASFLGDRNPRAVIVETSAKLAAHAARLGPEGLRRQPAPGKWSATAILCHLADCEAVFVFRLRLTLAEPYHTIQPFDQNAWAKSYGSFDANTALDVFSANRRWNLALLDTVTPQDLGKKLRHPERGEMTFQTLIETVAGHDLNHLEQLERL
jgi:hypothetical protein